MKLDFPVNGQQISLRPVNSDDDEFLCRVYASTRAEEMALVNWSEAQKDAFLRMQFDAQTAHYRLHYPTAEYYIIQKDDIPIGRLITERSPQSLLVMDIALLPAGRNLGIGTAILKDLMAEAAQTGVPVVLRVEFFNPVIRLYTRLGFIKTREINSVYHEMVWKPTLNLS